ncbi:MAG: phage holin family protein [Clostridia bacterium]
MSMMSVPIILSVVYAIIELLKFTFKANTKFLNFVPLVSGILGGVFGVISYYFAPTLIPTTNVIHAFLIGIFSGLSATGSNQIFKQITKLLNSKNNSDKN